MFKKTLVVLSLMLGAVSARAQVGTQVADIFNSTSSVSVSISSSALAGDITQLDSTCVSGRKALLVQNLNASANMFCGLVKANVSRTVGRKITPGASATFGAACSDFNGVRIGVWCCNDSSAAITAWVEQVGNK